MLVFISVLTLLYYPVLSTDNVTEASIDSWSNITASWTEWGNFSSCSVTCGIGEMVRNRTCDISLPSNVTNICNGTETDSKICTNSPCQPINGNWSIWSSFNECSKSCGGGVQTRQRQCDNPAPQYGGLDCDGDVIEAQLCNSHDCPGWTNKGKDFTFGFMRNYESIKTILTLFITTESEKDVNVYISAPSYNPSFSKTKIVHKRQIIKVQMDSSLMGSVGYIENKGIHITSDEDVVVYAISKQYASTDAFVVLPTAALGQEYYVVAWSERSTFMIVGTEDNTEVNIKLGQNSQSISVAGYNVGPGVSVTLKLDKFQTLFVASSSGDFTGTHVYGSKPIAVLGGSICARINAGACDHLVQQLLPIEKWGKDFVTVGMPGCRSSDTFRIVASLDMTTVNISGMPSHKLINSGDYYQFSLSDSTAKTISADKPIALALYANGGCGSGGLGDPAMVLIPAIQQFSSDYTFSTISLAGNDFHNSLALVIAESYINGLQFDGVNLPQATWKAVEGRPDIKYTEFRIASGAHSVSHNDSKVTFLALSTGVQEYNSYGYPAGFNFRQSVTNCSNDKTTDSNSTRGTECSLGLDPCKNQPCLNNGTCKPRGWTNYECICPSTYFGPVCEIDLCQPFPTDVVFLIDNSRSMGEKYFDLEKQFILNVTDDWTIDSDHFQVSIVSFAKFAKLEINFNTVNNITDFREKVSNLKYDGDISNLHYGLSTAKNILDSRNRRISFTMVKKYLVVLSDGLTTPPIHIQPVNSSTIETRVFALGEDVSHHFLGKITGNMNDVLPFDADKLKMQLTYELIHPMCSGCAQSEETDILVAIDTSRDMDRNDLIEVRNSIINQMFKKLGTDRKDIRFSMVTFDDSLKTVFVNRTYTNETQDLTTRQTAYFTRSASEIGNFTNIVSSLVDMVSDRRKGGRDSAKKIILIISQFHFKTDKASVKKIVNDTEIYTIGMNFDEETFESMLSLSPSPYHVGTIGSFFAYQVGTFLDAFISQLSYVKCEPN